MMTNTVTDTLKTTAPDRIDFTDLTIPEGQLIWNALSEVPSKFSYSLLKKLEKQIETQGVSMKE